jgi:hypothetical protein
VDWAQLAQDVLQLMAFVLEQMKNCQLGVIK